eukprot:TRINITY_DN18009_c0_g1_i1.p2 TRINITY_DN18009_c0_g1~~TRINITY_DN18009_c0_g1_i1.p2  ORF type:complete len:118 (-),score=35.27 TRINITY_DN18009_c0_g1_i1:134-487(-)
MCIRDRYSRVEICTGIMSVLQVQFTNNDANTVHYCMEEGLIDYMSYILELVGEKGRFKKEIITILFKIIELILVNKIKDKGLMLFNILAKLVFNIRIWPFCEYRVQVSLRLTNRNTL